MLPSHFSPNDYYYNFFSESDRVKLFFVLSLYLLSKRSDITLCIIKILVIAELGSAHQRNNICVLWRCFWFYIRKCENIPKCISLVTDQISHHKTFNTTNVMMNFQKWNTETHKFQISIVNTMLYCLSWTTAFISTRLYAKLYSMDTALCVRRETLSILWVAHLGVGSCYCGIAFTKQAWVRGIQQRGSHSLVCVSQRDVQTSHKNQSLCKWDQ